jgi:hypothetical protein
MSNYYLAGHFNFNAMTHHFYRTRFTIVFALTAWLIISGLTPSIAQPVNFGWALRFGNVDDDKGNCIVTDAAGYIYTTGNYNGLVDIDPGGNVVNLYPYGYTDFYIAKWDGTGALVWASSFGGSVHDNGTSLALDAAGNVYATGGFTGITDFDPGPNIYNLTSAGGLDVFVLKLDASGNFGWVKQMGAAQSTAIGGDEGKTIALDAAGNIFILGRFEGTADFDPGAGVANLTAPGGFGDVFVCKLTAQGDYVWAKQWGASGNNDWINAMALDDSSNVYSTGSFYSPIDFDPGPGNTTIAPGGQAGVYVSKLDSSGNFKWVGGFSKMGGFVQDVGSLAVDNQNNIFVGGTFSGTVDFNPGAQSNNFTSGSGSNGFIVKLNANGGYIWAKTLGGPGEIACIGLTTDVYNDVYASGWFSDFNPNTDFDPGSGTFVLTSNGYWDAYVCKLSGSGNFAWAKGWGAAFEDNAQSVTVDASANVYSTGYFNSTVDFDPTSGVFNLTGAGSADVFMHKMEQVGAGIAEADDALQFAAFPNPSGGNFMIVSSSIINNGLVEVYSLDGKKIYSEAFSGIVKKEIHLHEAPAGIYFCKVSDGKSQFVTKLLVERD